VSIPLGWRLTILLVWLVSLPHCRLEMPEKAAQPRATSPGEVAFRLAGPGGAALLVPVTINGQGPFNFVLDTGATFTCIDRQLVDQLGLPRRPGQVGVGVGIGSSGRVEIVTVDSLQVGSATGDQMMACAIDLTELQNLGVEIDGLLGLNFLKAFQVTLDFEREVLRLDEP
jgi:predicted aspartyl protease